MDGLLRQGRGRLRSASMSAPQVRCSGRRDKGSLPRLAKTGSHACYREGEIDHHQRQLRHFIGRLRELQRQRQAGHPDISLERAVERTWPSDIPRT